MVARATKCWATPTAESDMKYTLMENGCSKDSTFKSYFNDNGVQVLTFKSFAFVSDTESHVYLHCDLIACTADDDSCGSCSADVPAPEPATEAPVVEPETEAPEPATEAPVVEPETEAPEPEEPETEAPVVEPETEAPEPEE